MTLSQTRLKIIEALRALGILVASISKYDEDQAMNQSRATDAAHRLTQSTSLAMFTHLPIWSELNPSDIRSGLEALIKKTRQAFRDLEASTLDQGYTAHWHNIVPILELLTHDFISAQARIDHLQSVCFSEAVQAEFEKMQPALVKLSLEIGQSRPLFNALSQLQQDTSLSAVQRKVIDNNIKHMHHQGVGLDGVEKSDFLQLQQQLSQLTTDYSHHLILEAKNARIKVKEASLVVGIPDTVLKAAVDKAHEDGATSATYESGPWHFSLDGATYMTVMKSCENTHLRAVFFTRYGERGTDQPYDNREILQQILCLKQQKAQLLGFDNAAQLSIDQKMADHEQAVLDLLESLRVHAQPVAHEELAQLTAFANTHGYPHDLLKPWDLSFWREQYLKHHFNVDQEELRQYLQLPKVMRSLFDMMHDIFGLDISRIETHCGDQRQEHQIPTWHPDVEFYQVHENGEVIAGFYMDPYARPGEKRAGAWMNNVVDKSKALALEGHQSTLPIALFVLNARPPQGSQPGLISLDDVETLFHEFGHAMQHMLTRIEESDVSGINGVEWDAVEVASQFNENWVYQPSFLQSVTKHVATGESLDPVIIDKIIQSRHYFAANDCLRQVCLSLIDFKLHQDYGHGDQSLSPQAIENAIRQRILVTPYLESLSVLPAFSHIFAGGYSAGYYSYKWAEVMAADAFAAFEEVGLNNPQALRQQAKKYRDTILALGGSQSAQVVYRNFRGKDATTHALLRHQGLLKDELAQ